MTRSPGSKARAKQDAGADGVGPERDVPARLAGAHHQLDDAADQQRPADAGEHAPGDPQPAYAGGLVDVGAVIRGAVGGVPGPALAGAEQAGADACEHDAGARQADTETVDLAA